MGWSEIRLSACELGFVCPFPPSFVSVSVSVCLSNFVSVSDCLTVCLSVFHLPPTPLPLFLFCARTHVRAPSPSQSISLCSCLSHFVSASLSLFLCLSPSSPPLPFSLSLSLSLSHTSPLRRNDCSCGSEGGAGVRHERMRLTTRWRTGEKGGGGGGGERGVLSRVRA